ncbi:hypothetical protein [Prosthecomicrobium pneumaticum]|uniref:Glycosyltransferase RgtA/B/C/D-like domain-containing protein n=1 Tax=Prosthecomicrobium pneumaticum TaxID=81895 RepID=A0A7W9CUI6_9HYPH|nr:hypothetical protein [Prosthecomicrobium pneumaticum]MBB5751861.1 hypothetical protein [Prosthecomicrobium pneumaticum]
MKNEGHPTSRARSVFAVAGFLLTYVLIVFSLHGFSTGGGWAAQDSRFAHFPIINYFIQNGFDLGYPPDRIAMFPGMHAVFALVAILFRLPELRFDGISALLIQSVFGVFFLSGVIRIASKLRLEPGSATVLYLPVFSSSYPLFSWVWPTTDLGSLAFYVWMLVLLIPPRRWNASSAGAYSLLTALSLLFRQSNALLGAAPLADLLVRRWRRGGGGAGLSVLAWATFPLLVAGLGAILLLSIWGALVPPGFAGMSAVGPNLVAGAHILALTGLIGWPFALVLLGQFGFASRTSLIVGLAGLATTVLCVATMPLNFDPASGRFGSIVWTLQGPLSALHFEIVLVSLSIFVGSLIVIAMGVDCYRKKSIYPEIVMFFMFSVSLIAQRYSWQRYVEPQLLLTLGVYCSRLPMIRIVLWIVIVWFALYGTLSIFKGFMM